MSNTSTNELSNIIVKAIEDEPFLNKETLIPKITSIIKGFRLTLDITNYNKVLKPTEHSKLLRHNRIKEIEANFWKHQLQNIVGKKDMQKYYDNLDELRKQFKE